MTTRTEHLQFCKNRAHQYLDNGDAASALASMFGDLEKHPDTANHPAIEIGTMMMITGRLSSPEEARRFIDGFN